MMRVSTQLVNVFTALSAHPEGMYGFQVMHEKPIKSGTLYPILHRLLADGYVNVREETTTTKPRRTRKVYVLTDKGTEFAAGLKP